MEFPDKNKFVEFFSYVSSAEHKVRYANFIYKYSISKATSPEEILKIEPEKGTRISMVIVFLSFTLKIPAEINIQSLRIYNATAIIEYFELADDRFWDAFKTEIKGSEIRKNGFLIQVVKALMYLDKDSVLQIAYEDLNKLYNEDFYHGHAKKLSFPTMLERVIDKITKKAKPQKIMYCKYRGPDYGLMEGKIKEIVQQYLDKKYTQKNKLIKSPLFALKSFFDWLYRYKAELKKIEDITEEDLNKYKTFLSENGNSPRTRQLKYDHLMLFFEYLQVNNMIEKDIIEYGERLKIQYEVKPRMFETREHNKKVLNEIVIFKPADECEELIKKYLLITSATGLRAKDVLWLGPDCLSNVQDGIGEITVEVKDKTRIINKTTSVLPQGIEPIEQLKERFERLDKIKFYNEKTNKYVYCLFQYNRKILGVDKIYNIFRELIEKADLKDDKGIKVDYSNIKLHALRHQKFNDIYEVTGGNATAVKIDSCHTKIEMVKQYTKQQEQKKIYDAMKLIEQGEIIGRGAEILKEILDTSLSKELYIDTVKKMNLFSTIDTDINKNITKYLGFGFCIGDNSSCKLKKICEACDFFYTCNSFEDDLKERYAKNFMVIKNRLDIKEDNINISEIDRENILNLKYQERWLNNIGVDKEEINNLKKQYLKGV